MVVGGRDGERVHVCDAWAVVWRSFAGRGGSRRWEHSGARVPLRPVRRVRVRSGAEITLSVTLTASSIHLKLLFVAALCLVIGLRASTFCGRVVFLGPPSRELEQARRTLRP